MKITDEMIAAAQDELSRIISWTVSRTTAELVLTAALSVMPAVRVNGLTKWSGWDQSNMPWSQAKHQDAVCRAIFGDGWSMEDASALIGFINQTWGDSERVLSAIEPGWVGVATASLNWQWPNFDDWWLHHLREADDVTVLACLKKAFEAGRAALKGDKQIKPVAWAWRDNFDEQFVTTLDEPEICLEKQPLVTLSAANAAIEERDKRIAELERERDFLRTKSVENARERNAAERLVEEAGKALEPFSDVAGEMFARNWEDPRVVVALDNPDDAHCVTYADFRAARSLLDKIGGVE